MTWIARKMWTWLVMKTILYLKSIKLITKIVRLHPNKMKLKSKTPQKNKKVKLRCLY